MSLDTPSISDPVLQTYLQAAEQLQKGEITEAELPSVQVTPLTPTLLDALTKDIQRASVICPHLGWAIAAVTDAAAQHTGDTSLQALAAFQLARAANAWVQPERVAEAASRARAGFVAENKPGWVAACDWQAYALPWTRNDYQEVASTLRNALETLESTQMDDFSPHCRLSLAYSELLQSHFETAMVLIEASERAFAARGNNYHQAQAWLHKSSCLRRQGKYREALNLLESALKVFRQSKASVDIAKTYYQMAFCQVDLYENYDAAEKYAASAVQVFKEQDISLWVALCFDAIGQMAYNQGKLERAEHNYHSAYEIWSQYTIWGPQADILGNIGKLNLARGDYEQSAKYLCQAKELYTQVGSSLMVAISDIYLGEAYAQLGRFQLALHHLEQAESSLNNLQNWGRLAECEHYLAEVWLQLGAPDPAGAYFKQAKDHSRRAEMSAFLCVIDIRLARLRLEQNKPEEALAIAKEALSLIKTHGIDILHPVSSRLLGEINFALGDSQKALTFVKDAMDSSKTMGLLDEQVLGWIAYARISEQLTHWEEARQAWQQALNLCQHGMPQLAWRVHWGLAELVEKEGDMALALKHFRQMADALCSVRRGFWQPAVAGTFAEKAVHAMEKAVHFAMEHSLPQDALTFIEESKAHTLDNQLAIAEKRVSIPSSELAALKGEIRWLQTRLKTDFSTSGALRTNEQNELIQQLKEKTATFDLLAGRLERKHIPYVSTKAHFMLEDFRACMFAAAGDDWIALDYFQVENEVLCLIVTSKNCRLWRKRISQRARMALRLCLNARRPLEALMPADFEALGELLIPESILERLTSNTCLLLAPHRQLHHIPWPALIIPHLHETLVNACVPTLIPSFSNLSLLSRRTAPPQPSRRDGLILAVTDFQNRYPSLPHVRDEVEAFSLYLGPNAKILQDEQAAWTQITSLHRERPLNNFAFLHIASHAFYDSLSGRASKIVLADQDVWNDQLWDIAPLPRLVTLSACSGLQNRTYAGDEHVGLATTCLAAGAQYVIGSLWPVLDPDATALMIGFYEHYLSGKGAAQSLALAQRAALQARIPSTRWGGFLCIGLLGYPPPQLPLDPPDQSRTMG